MQQRHILEPGTVLDGRYSIDRSVAGPAGACALHEATELASGKRVIVRSFEAPRAAGTPRDASAEALAVHPDPQHLWAELRHAGIERLLEVIAVAGVVHQIVEPVAGETLEAWLVAKGRPLSRDETVRLLVNLLDILQLVHARGLVHGDISPESILVRSDGLPVLTIPRMPLSAHTVQSDIRDLGATLYRCIDGRAPEARGLMSPEAGRAPAAQVAAAHFRAPFLAAIDRCLDARPDRRPQSIGELRQLLQARPQGSGWLPGLGQRLEKSLTEAGTKGWLRLSAPAKLQVPSVRRDRVMRQWRSSHVLALLVMAGLAFAVIWHTATRPADRPRITLPVKFEAERQAEIERRRREAERRPSDGTGGGGRATSGGPPRP